MMVKKTKILDVILQGAELPPDATLDSMLEALSMDPPKMAAATKVLLNQRKQDRAEKAVLQEQVHELGEQLTQLREPPLFPAEVVRVHPDRRLDVVFSGRRLLVNPVPELDVSEIRTGDEVLLDREGTTVVGKNEVPAVIGTVATVADADGPDGTVVLRGIGDEEMVAICAAEVADSLEPGNRVLVRRESQCVTAKLPDKERIDYQLETPPATTFDDIGGLDATIARMRDTLSLTLEHADVAAEFLLEQMAGAVLVGPPGVGKTLFAGAIANYLSASGQPTRFLNVKPGELRGVYYGQAEARIRELFRFARSVPGMVVIFFDELDNFGVRGDGNTIDGRVLTALLVEMSGLDPADNLFVVAATNRIDLCDEALVRQGRVGDMVFAIPRPDAQAARQILGKHLSPALPYGRGDGATDSVHGRDALVEAGVSYLYGSRGSYGPLASVVFANAEEREVMPRDVMSGALIAGAVKRAKQSAALRRVQAAKAGDAAVAGLLVEDLLDAIDDALGAETTKLSTPAAARRILDMHDADQIVRVDAATDRPAPRHRYLRAV